jgi:hypothetical protein
VKRTFNYTGRKKILQEKVAIKLNRRNNSIESFTATIDLEGMDLPPNANVYIEVYHSTDYMRYHFGTVGNLIHPQDTKLEHLAYTENLMFRVLLVDVSGRYGQILAAADNISPIATTGKKSILPVDFRDIGQQIWNIDYSGHEGAPMLIFNKNIPNIENLAKSDFQFFFFVYPAVIKEIVMKMAFVDGVDSTSDPSIDWHADWLKCTKIISNQDLPENLNQQSENFNKDDVEYWIDHVIDDFCSNHLTKWRAFINQIRGEVE